MRAPGAWGKREGERKAARSRTDSPTGTVWATRGRAAQARPTARRARSLRSPARSRDPAARRLRSTTRAAAHRDAVACHAHSMSRHQQHLILNRAPALGPGTNCGTACDIRRLDAERPIGEPVHCSQRQLRVDSRAPARARCAAGPPARRVACPLLSGLFHTRHALPPRFRCHAPFTRTPRSWSRFKSKSIRGIQHRCPSRLSLSLSRARALPAASPRSTLLDRRRRRRETRAGLRGKEPASTPLRRKSHEVVTRSFGITKQIMRGVAGIGRTRSRSSEDADGIGLTRPLYPAVSVRRCVPPSCAAAPRHHAPRAHCCSPRRASPLS